MKPDHPTPRQIPALQALWQEAFGDAQSFIDSFFRSAFDFQRCMCITQEADVLAAAYWFDVCFDGKKAAYIYAVATGKAHRGRGLCRRLMDGIHSHLLSLGYSGTMLVPGDDGLRTMYGTMGYTDFGGMDTLCCAAGGEADLQEILPVEFAVLRRQRLPEGGVLQEGENLAFLQQHFRFFRGENCLFTAAVADGKLYAPEFWGDSRLCPGIAHALGAASGSFRMAGATPFAMYRPLSGGPAPTYFAFAFD